MFGVKRNSFTGGAVPSSKKGAEKLTNENKVSITNILATGDEKEIEPIKDLLSKAKANTQFFKEIYEYIDEVVFKAAIGPVDAFKTVVKNLQDTTYTDAKNEKKTLCQILLTSTSQDIIKKTNLQEDAPLIRILIDSKLNKDPFLSEDDIKEILNSLKDQKRELLSDVHKIREKVGVKTTSQFKEALEASANSDSIGTNTKNQLNFFFKLGKIDLYETVKEVINSKIIGGSKDKQKNLGQLVENLKSSIDPSDKETIKFLKEVITKAMLELMEKSSLEEVFPNIDSENIKDLNESFTSLTKIDRFLNNKLQPIVLNKVEERLKSASDKKNINDLIILAECAAQNLDKTQLTGNSLVDSLLLNKDPYKGLLDAEEAKVLITNKGDYCLSDSAVRLLTLQLPKLSKIRSKEVLENLRESKSFKADVAKHRASLNTFKKQTFSNDWIGGFTAKEKQIAFNKVTPHVEKLEKLYDALALILKPQNLDLIYSNSNTSDLADLKRDLGEYSDLIDSNTNIVDSLRENSIELESFFKESVQKESMLNLSVDKVENAANFLRDLGEPPLDKSTLAEQLSPSQITQLKTINPKMKKDIKVKVLPPLLNNIPRIVNLGRFEQLTNDQLSDIKIQRNLLEQSKTSENILASLEKEDGGILTTATPLEVLQYTENFLNRLGPKTPESTFVMPHKSNKKNSHFRQLESGLNTIESCINTNSWKDNKGNLNIPESQITTVLRLYKLVNEVTESENVTSIKNALTTFLIKRAQCKGSIDYNEIIKANQKGKIDPKKTTATEQSNAIKTIGRFTKRFLERKQTKSLEEKRQTVATFEKILRQTNQQLITLRELEKDLTAITDSSSIDDEIKNTLKRVMQQVNINSDGNKTYEDICSKQLAAIKPLCSYYLDQISGDILSLEKQTEYHQTPTTKHIEEMKKDLKATKNAVSRHDNDQHTDKVIEHKNKIRTLTKEIFELLPTTEKIDFLAEQLKEAGFNFGGNKHLFSALSGLINSSQDTNRTHFQQDTLKMVADLLSDDFVEALKRATADLKKSVTELKTFEPKIINSANEIKEDGTRSTHQYQQLLAKRCDLKRQLDGGISIGTQQTMLRTLDKMQREMEDRTQACSDETKTSFINNLKKMASESGNIAVTESVRDEDTYTLLDSIDKENECALAKALDMNSRSISSFLSDPSLLTLNKENVLNITTALKNLLDKLNEKSLEANTGNGGARRFNLLHDTKKQLKKLDNQIMAYHHGFGATVKEAMTELLGKTVSTFEPESATSIDGGTFFRKFRSTLFQMKMALPPDDYENQKKLQTLLELDKKTVLNNETDTKSVDRWLKTTNVPALDGITSSEASLSAILSNNLKSIQDKIEKNIPKNPRDTQEIVLDNQDVLYEAEHLQNNIANELTYVTRHTMVDTSNRLERIKALNQSSDSSLLGLAGVTNLHVLRQAKQRAYQDNVQLLRDFLETVDLASETFTEGDLQQITLFESKGKTFENTSINKDSQEEISGLHTKVLNTLISNVNTSLQQFIKSGEASIQSFKDVREFIQDGKNMFNKKQMKLAEIEWQKIETDVQQAIDKKQEVNRDKLLKTYKEGIRPKMDTNKSTFKIVTEQTLQRSFAPAYALLNHSITTTTEHAQLGTTDKLATNIFTDVLIGVADVMTAKMNKTTDKDNIVKEGKFNGDKDIFTLEIINKKQLTPELKAYLTAFFAVSGDEFKAHFDKERFKVGELVFADGSKTLTKDAFNNMLKNVRNPSTKAKAIAIQMSEQEAVSVTNLAPFTRGGLNLYGKPKTNRATIVGASITKSRLLSTPAEKKIEAASLITYIEPLINSKDLTDEIKQWAEPRFKELTFNIKEAKNSTADKTSWLDSLIEKAKSLKQVLTTCATKKNVKILKQIKQENKKMVNNKAENNKKDLQSLDIIRGYSIGIINNQDGINNMKGTIDGSKINSNTPLHERIQSFQESKENDDINTHDVTLLVDIKNFSTDPKGSCIEAIQNALKLSESADIDEALRAYELKTLEEIKSKDKTTILDPLKQDANKFKPLAKAILKDIVLDREDYPKIDQAIDNAVDKIDVVNLNLVSLDLPGKKRPVEIDNAIPNLKLVTNHENLMKAAYNTDTLKQAIGTIFSNYGGIDHIKSAVQDKADYWQNKKVIQLIECKLDFTEKLKILAIAESDIFSDANYKGVNLLKTIVCHHNFGTNKFKNLKKYAVVKKYLEKKLGSKNDRSNWEKILTNLVKVNTLEGIEAACGKDDLKTYLQGKVYTKILEKCNGDNLLHLEEDIKGQLNKILQEKNNDILIKIYENLSKVNRNGLLNTLDNIKDLLDGPSNFKKNVVTSYLTRKLGNTFSEKIKEFVELKIDQVKETTESFKNLTEDNDPNFETIMKNTGIFKDGQGTSAYFESLLGGDINSYVNEANLVSQISNEVKETIIDSFVDTVMKSKKDNKFEYKTEIQNLLKDYLKSEKVDPKGLFGGPINNLKNQLQTVNFEIESLDKIILDLNNSLSSAGVSTGHLKNLEEVFYIENAFSNEACKSQFSVKSLAVNTVENIDKLLFEYQFFINLYGRKAVKSKSNPTEKLSEFLNQLKESDKTKYNKFVQKILQQTVASTDVKLTDAEIEGASKQFCNSLSDDAEKDEMITNVINGIPKNENLNKFKEKIEEIKKKKKTDEGQLEAANNKLNGAINNIKNVLGEDSDKYKAFLAVFDSKEECISSGSLNEKNLERVKKYIECPALDLNKSNAELLVGIASDANKKTKAIKNLKKEINGIASLLSNYDNKTLNSLLKDIKENDDSIDNDTFKKVQALLDPGSDLKFKNSIKMDNINTITATIKTMRDAMANLKKAYSEIPKGTPNKEGIQAVFKYIHSNNHRDTSVTNRDQKGNVDRNTEKAIEYLTEHKGKKELEKIFAKNSIISVSATTYYFHPENITQNNINEIATGIKKANALSNLKEAFKNNIEINKILEKDEALKNIDIENLSKEKILEKYASNAINDSNKKGDFKTIAKSMIKDAVSDKDSYPQFDEALEKMIYRFCCEDIKEIEKRPTKEIRINMLKEVLLGIGDDEKLVEEIDKSINSVISKIDNMSYKEYTENRLNLISIMKTSYNKKVTKKMEELFNRYSPKFAESITKDLQNNKDGYKNQQLIGWLKTTTINTLQNAWFTNDDYKDKQLLVTLVMSDDFNNEFINKVKKVDILKEYLKDELNKKRQDKWEDVLNLLKNINGTTLQEKGSFKKKILEVAQSKVSGKEGYNEIHMKKLVESGSVSNDEWVEVCSGDAGSTEKVLVLIASYRLLDLRNNSGLTTYEKDILENAANSRLNNEVLNNGYSTVRREGKLPNIDLINTESTQATSNKRLGSDNENVLNGFINLSNNIRDMIKDNDFVAATYEDLNNIADAFEKKLATDVILAKKRLDGASKRLIIDNNDEKNKINTEVKSIVARNPNSVENLSVETFKSYLSAEAQEVLTGMISRQGLITAENINKLAESLEEMATAQEDLWGACQSLDGDQKKYFMAIVDGSYKEGLDESVFDAGKEMVCIRDNKNIILKILNKIKIKVENSKGSKLISSLGNIFDVNNKNYPEIITAKDMTTLARAIKEEKKIIDELKKSNNDIDEFLSDDLGDKLREKIYPTKISMNLLNNNKRNYLEDFKKKMNRGLNYQNWKPKEPITLTKEVISTLNAFFEENKNINEVLSPKIQHNNETFDTIDKAMNYFFEKPDIKE